MFAPTLTALSSAKTAMRMNHVICGCDIVYENGACVHTSFVTSYGYPTILESYPELTGLVNRKMAELLPKSKKQLPKYEYPDEVVTAAMLGKYSKYGIYFSVSADEAVQIPEMDAQRVTGKTIYGGGLLLSTEAAARKAKARKAAAERVVAAPTIWQLSEREKEIVRKLSRNGRVRYEEEALAYTE